MGIEVECPSITSFTTTNTRREESSLVATFEVTTEGIEPEKYIWDFGDGSTTETTTPTAEHTYPCKEGEDVTFEVTVTVNPHQLGRLDVEIGFVIDTHRTRQSLIYPFYVTHPEKL